MEEIDKTKSGNPMEGEARGRMSIEEFLKKDEEKDLLRFLTAGSVDDGKSTLIGYTYIYSRRFTKTSLTHSNATANVWEMRANISIMPFCSTD